MGKTNSPIPHITHFQVSTHWDSDEKIRLIETFPDSDSILIIWFKLLAMCARQEADGNIKFPPEIDLSPKNLSIMLSRPENTVKLALELFTRFNMVSLEDHNVTLLNWPKHQHFDALERIKEKARDRVKRFRDKQKQLSAPTPLAPLASNSTCNVTETLPVTLRNAGEERRGEEKRRDKSNKDIYIEKGIIPEWINKETWNAYLEMRKRIKAVPTDYAVTLLIEKLIKFKTEGYDPNEILNQSIMNNWKGVFPLKDGNGNGHKELDGGKYKGNPSQKPAGAFDGLE